MVWKMKAGILDYGEDEKLYFVSIQEQCGKTKQPC